MQDFTSFHKLNSDNGLSLLGKIQWMFLNFINNNYFPNKHQLKISRFNFDLILENDWDMINKKSSPSRALTDLFWIKLNWKELLNELNEINIVDTGCGNGEYFVKLNQFSEEKINTYCGLDIQEKENWKKLKNENTNLDFKVINSANLTNHIPLNSNLFISLSAIEHFENDLIYFRNIKEYIDKTNNNTVQIHLFPSAECLKKYLWHGIRQYTPRTIQKITDIFENENSYSCLYELGGNSCNKLHWEYITKPIYFKKVDYRDIKEEEYFSKLKKAILHDNQQKTAPSFYALVIHSNYKNKLQIS